MAKIQPSILAKTLYELTSEASPKEAQLQIENFAAYLKKKHLLKLVPKIIEQFNSYYNKKQSEADIILTTAKAVSEVKKKAMAKALEQEYGYKKVNLIEVVDPHLIGGYKLQIEDLLIDASVQGRITQLRETLISNI